MNTQPQPHPLLDPFVPALSAWTLVTAVSAGIFDALSGEASSPAGLARELDLDPPGVERLMPVLAHLGYLESDGERYLLSQVSKESLVPGSRHQLMNWVRFCRTQLLAMSRLESTLATGRPVDLYDLMETRDELRIHQLAMAETAGPVAEWVASHTPVPAGAELMLDVGGSHGLYSAAICRRHPPLRAEVMEPSGVVDVARGVAAEVATTDVVTHIEGDILETDLTKDYALVFLGNLVHHVRPEQLSQVLDTSWQHLEPGGTIAIWDIEQNGGGGDLVSSLFSLFFYLTSHGSCRSRRQIQAALEEAGFARIVTQKPEQPSLQTLIVATKPAP